jgi:hypothetical protein
MLLAVGGCTSGLRYASDEAWVSETPSSDSRIAQYTLPAAAGEEPPTLVIYHFGGGGAGSIDANLDRWCDQFEQTDGRESREVAQVSTWSAKGLTFYTIDVSGTYVAQLRPGVEERHNKPGQRMLAAIIQTDDGPYYVKLLGPERSVEASKPEFEALLASMSWGPGGTTVASAEHP